MGISDDCRHVDFDELEQPHKKENFTNNRADIGNGDVAFEGSIGDSSGKSDGVSFANTLQAQKV